MIKKIMLVLIATNILSHTVIVDERTDDNDGSISVNINVVWDILFTIALMLCHV